jgi:Lrp/AsnC family transcriptional regulator, leucine-responsive regulatory protein
LVSKVDDVDWRLLLELQQNARTSFSELGRRVGLTAPAVAERVRRLEETGVIKGYRVDLDVQRLGYTVTAVIRLQIPEGGCARFARIAPEFREIHECYRITGSDSYVLKVVLPSIQHLESLIDRLATHGTTITSVVLSTPLDHRLVEPPFPPLPGSLAFARSTRAGAPDAPAPAPPAPPEGVRTPGAGVATAGEPHAVPAVIPNGRRPVASRATR